MDEINQLDFFSENCYLLRVSVLAIGNKITELIFRGVLVGKLFFSDIFYHCLEENIKHILGFGFYFYFHLRNTLDYSFWFVAKSYAIKISHFIAIFISDCNFRNLHPIYEMFSQKNKFSLSL